MPSYSVFRIGTPPYEEPPNNPHTLARPISLTRSSGRGPMDGCAGTLPLCFVSVLLPVPEAVDPGAAARCVHEGHRKAMATSMQNRAPGLQTITRVGMNAARRE